MSVVAILGLAVLCVALALLLWREQRGRRQLSPSPRRILFPIAGTRLSERALDAALRLARAENATLVPAYLATVPMRLPIETAIPRQCETAMPLLEAVEHRATAVGVAVDARLGAGRTIRHAVTRLFDDERFDRVIVTAGARSSDFSGEDIAWLLDSAPTEVVVLRPRGTFVSVAGPMTAGARSVGGPGCCRVVRREARVRSSRTVDEPMTSPAGAFGRAGETVPESRPSSGRTQPASGSSRDVSERPSSSRNASTTRGSNWEPAQPRSSSRAASAVSAGRYTRSLVIAS